MVHTSWSPIQSFSVSTTQGGHDSSEWQKCVTACSQGCTLLHISLHSGGLVPQATGGYITVTPQRHLSSSKPIKEKGFAGNPTFLTSIVINWMSLDNKSFLMLISHQYYKKRSDENSIRSFVHQAPKSKMSHTSANDMQNKCRFWNKKYILGAVTKDIQHRFWETPLLMLLLK